MAALRYVVTLLIVPVGLFLLAVGGAGWTYHASGADRRLDPASRPSLAFFDSSGLAAAAYNRTALQRNGPQVVLIGASNMIKVSAASVEALVGIPTHNMSISGGEPRDFGRLVDLALEATPPASRRDLIFVVGVTYASFTDLNSSEVRPLDDQLLRFGIYGRDSVGRVKLRPPQATLPAALAVIRPLALEDRIWQAAAQRDASVISALVEGRPSGVFRPVDFKTPAITPQAERQAFLARRRAAEAYPLTDASLGSLQPVAERVSRASARLIVVDLPIPSWHAQGVPAFAAYQQRKLPFLKRLQHLPGVYYLNLQQGFPDETFYDSMHPRPTAVGLWAQRLAAGIRSLPDRPRS